MITMGFFGSDRENANGQIDRTGEVNHMLERDITAAIMRYLKTVPECFAWKTHGGMYGTAGIPDIVACIRGRFVAFEVKRDGGKLTKLQEMALTKINAAGGTARLIRGVDDVKSILNTIN